MDKDEDLERIFQLGSKYGLMISVHAEDEAVIRANRFKYKDNFSDPSVHSKIRDRSAAARATSKAISLAKKYDARLCILHMSTSDEVELVRQGKASGVKVFAEVAPHHLFLDESDYVQNGTKVQMNPPLRTESDRLALWKGINDGIIDFLGTDHAPHTLDEKLSPYGEAPSGVPSIELMLPLMLDAVSKGLISLQRVIELTSQRAKEVFRLEPSYDAVLVDLNLEKMVDDAELKTKCQWSPYHGRRLKGWPVCTILKDNLYETQEIICQKLITAALPIYDIQKTYLENAESGPFFTDSIPDRVWKPESEWIDFLGFQVASPIGVPAGPLLNSKWTTLAARLGFDIVIYKTIRECECPSHPLPNVMFVDTGGSITQERIGDYRSPLSIAEASSLQSPILSATLPESPSI